jgi:hypothetical protein
MSLGLVRVAYECPKRVPPHSKKIRGATAGEAEPLTGGPPFLVLFRSQLHHWKCVALCMSTSRFYACTLQWSPTRSVALSLALIDLGSVVMAIEVISINCRSSSPSRRHTQRRSYPDSHRLQEPRKPRLLPSTDLKHSPASKPHVASFSNNSYCYFTAPLPKPRHSPVFPNHGPNQTCAHLFPIDS